MQQDPFFYPGFTQEPRLQYPNAEAYSVPPNTAPWSGNYIPEANLGHVQSVPDSFHYGSQLQPNITPLSGTTPTISWAHSVPSLMPWVTQSEASIPDPVVRFTAPFPPDPCTSQTATSWELLNNLGGNKTNANMHLKRKSDLDVIEPETPHKLCVTEERMTARMRELHISNKYSVPADSSSFGPYSDSSSYSDTPQKSATTLQQLEAMLKESREGNLSSKSLVLAPELKKLVEPEKIFARTFFDKVERPSMAVVLWQPQNKLLPNGNNNSTDSKAEEKESNSSNNSLTEGDNNNFLSQLQLNTICNQNLFNVATNNETSSLIHSEEIMDT